MNAASQDLCKELYDLTDWAESEHPKDWYINIEAKKGPMFIAPRYDLGFLLRKMPSGIYICKHDNDYGVFYTLNFEYPQDHNQAFPKAVEETSPNPEDAVCRLLIDLLKRGTVS